MTNLLKTTFLLTTLTLLFVFVGHLLGGESGMTSAFLFACLFNLGAYWFSDRMVLAIYRAVPLAESDAPEIYSMVRELTEKAKLPMPRIYLIPSAAPNAFATGRNPRHAVVAVTKGIVDVLNEEELKGVLAHELAHVEHRDILISTMAATLAGAISLLADMARWALMFGGSRRDDRGGRNTHPLVLMLMVILVPLAAALIQLAVSRSREYGADEKGGALSGNPLYLANALRKLEAASKRIPLHEAKPSTAHLFIVNPLRADAFTKLFSTHPPVEDRVARLEAQAREMGL